MQAHLPSLRRLIWLLPVKGCCPYRPILRAGGTARIVVRPWLQRGVAAGRVACSPVSRGFLAGTIVGSGAAR